MYSIFLHRTRPSVPVVYVDGQDGPLDTDRRSIRGRNTYRRRRIRVSRVPWARRLLPERRFSYTAWVQHT